MTSINLTKPSQVKWSSLYAFSPSCWLKLVRARYLHSPSTGKTPGSWAERKGWGIWSIWVPISQLRGGSTGKAFQIAHGRLPNGNFTAIGRVHSSLPSSFLNPSTVLIASIFCVEQERSQHLFGLCPVWLGKQGTSYTLTFPCGRK